MNPAAPKRAPDDDARILDAMHRAQYFMVSIWIGPGQGYFQAPLTTLAQARQAGVYLETIYGHCRLSMVSAVAADGRAAMFIPRDLDEIYHEQQQTGAHNHAKPTDTDPRHQPGAQRSASRLGQRLAQADREQQHPSRRWR